MAGLSKSAKSRAKVINGSPEKQHASPDKSENINDDSASDDQKVLPLSIENTFSPKHHDSSFNTFSPKILSLMNSKHRAVGLKDSLLHPVNSS